MTRITRENIGRIGIATSGKNRLVGQVLAVEGDTADIALLVGGHPLRVLIEEWDLELAPPSAPKTGWYEHVDKPVAIDGNSPWFIHNGDAHAFYITPEGEVSSLIFHFDENPRFFEGLQPLYNI